MTQASHNPSATDVAAIVGQGLVCYRAADYTAAAAVFQSALTLNPQHCDALHLLGCVREAQGNLDEAIRLVSLATVGNPSAYPYFYNLGNLLVKQGRFNEAVVSYARAIHVKPDYAFAHNNMGIALRKQGKRDASTKCFQTAVRYAPGYADAHYNLGLEWRAIGQMPAAIASYKRAIEIQPKNADAHYALGNAYFALNRIEEACKSFQQAVQLAPQDVKSQTNLGSMHMLMGRLPEAIVSFKKVLLIDPIAVGAFSNQVMAASYAFDDPTLTLAQGIQWNDAFVAEHDPTFHSHSNSLEPERRLRIGYVSADFRRHAAAYWIEPLLAYHDHKHFEIFCYDNSDSPDDVTDRLKSNADHWVECEQMDDDALTHRVKDDGIDILVDLSGHTTGNRLLVFARQAAPIQISWFGFPVTTGLKTIQYRFTDDVIDPPSQANVHYSETLIRFDRFYAAYKPESSVPVSNVRPLGKKRGVTFGSFNSYVKVRPEMLALWCEILLQVPHSRLLMQASGLGGAEINAHIRTYFKKRGVDVKRLEIRGWTGLTEYFQLGQEVDIALDPYPFNGGVTTCHALWMGLPVVTMSGESAASRVGRSILSRMGLTELIAKNQTEYVAIAVNLAKNHAKLSELRESLREKMMAGGILDGGNLAQQAESAYRTVWRDWCTQHINISCAV